MEYIGVMSRDGTDEAKESSTLGMHRSEEVEQLLPGILDEITLNLVAPKLPWTTFHMLSSVSRPWLRAIQSHEVYKARVRSKCTEPLIAYCGHAKYPSSDITIALFSIREGSSRLLPPIPGLGPNPVWSRQRVFLDGKLYVLGGEVYEQRDYACAEVYVLDLAGQREWKQCASMANARSRFGCGIKDGKIHAFGGQGHRATVYESEVYDPKKDAWSPISCCMHHGDMYQQVTTVGDEMFVHSGRLGVSTRENTSNAAVYHPLKDKWRIVENFNGNSGNNALTIATVWTVKGKLHKLTGFGVQVFDIHTSSWNPLQPFSFGESEPKFSFKMEPVAGVTVDDEALALVDSYEDMGGRQRSRQRSFFIKSQGVGGENGKVLWQKLPRSPHINHDDPLCFSFLIDDYPLSCLIEL